MRKLFHTKEGKKVVELTLVEVAELYRATGDEECLRELTKEEFSKAVSANERIDVLAQALGLVPKKA